MRTKVSPALVGAFVIGAFALIVIALLSFGGMNFFSKPQRFVVYFDESIHGLDLGSPVKLRGVRIGRVVDVNLRYDEAKNESVAAVVCEFNRDAITGTNGAPLNIASRGALQALIDHGLRAQLEVQSLATGLLFVGLNFVDPQQNPDPGLRDPRYVVVPALPSTISEFQASLTDILSDFKRADVAGLSRELKGLIVDVHRQVNTLDLNGLLAQWRKTGESADALIASLPVKESFANLNGAIADLRGVIARLDTQIGTNGAQLETTLGEARETLDAFRNAAATLQRFVAAQRNLGSDADRALAKFSDAADAVQRLADYLERNPNALITGRRLPEAQKRP